MEVEREVPLQSLEQLGGYLPNQHFPSDHLPVVFDLRFRSADEADSAAQAAAAAAAAAAGNGNGHAAGPAPRSNGGGGGSSSNGGVPGKGGDTTTRLLPAAMHHVGEAVEAAVRGEVLAVPTDTLYGLACCANSSPGVRHIYASKRRGDHKPLAIAVADVEDVQRYGEVQVSPGLEV
jgi:2',5'-phosphodiesterase